MMIIATFLTCTAAAAPSAIATAATASLRRPQVRPCITRYTYSLLVCCYELRQHNKQTRQRAFHYQYLRETAAVASQIAATTTKV